MAKTRRGKPASRAKATKKKSSAKRTKKSTRSKSKMMKAGKQVPPDGLNLKQLKADIATARDILTKRLEGVDPASEKGKKLSASRSTIDQWSVDISSMCGATAADEPCGTTMVIS